jgi:hypothetical protein
MAEHEHNAFVTLTYDDEHLPKDGSLQPEHLTKWLKRIRKKHDYPLRYYAVGEYGDRTERPHYHIALFGFQSCLRGRTHLGRKNGCCVQCNTIASTWKYGKCFLGSLTKESASYVAGYVTKKLTSKTDERLNGRYPEFARMSRNPGIGGSAAHDIASTLLTHNLQYVPNTLRLGGKQTPLGSYLKGKVREISGLPYAPPNENPKLSELSEEIYSDEEGYKQERLREALISQNIHKAEAQERKEAAVKRRKTI